MNEVYCYCCASIRTLRSFHRTKVYIHAWTRPWTYVYASLFSFWCACVFVCVRVFVPKLYVCFKPYLYRVKLCMHACLHLLCAGLCPRTLRLFQAILISGKVVCACVRAFAVCAGLRTKTLHLFQAILIMSSKALCACMRAFALCVRVWKDLHPETTFVSSHLCPVVCVCMCVYVCVFACEKGSLYHNFTFVSSHTYIRGGVCVCAFAHVKLKGSLYWNFTFVSSHTYIKQSCVCMREREREREKWIYNTTHICISKMYFIFMLKWVQNNSVLKTPKYITSL